MVYLCKTCGSREVYHHCRPAVVLARPVVARAVELPPEPTPPPPSTPPPAPTPPTPKPPTTSTTFLCMDCKTNEACVLRRGCHDGLVHDRLCRSCYDKLIELIGEYIPSPGKPPPLHRPGLQLLHTLKRQRRVPLVVGIASLYCKGELLRARTLLRSGARTIQSDRV